MLLLSACSRTDKAVFINTSECLKGAVFSFFSCCFYSELLSMGDFRVTLYSIIRVKGVVQLA